MSLSQQAADTFRPPEITGNHLVHQASTSNSATSTSLALLSGKYYVTFQAVTTDVFVVLKLGTSVASVTTSTGFCIPAGTSVSWFIESARSTYIEHITASAAGTLKWYISSPIYEAPLFRAGT